MTLIPVIRRGRGKALPAGAVYVGRPSRLLGQVGCCLPQEDRLISKHAKSGVAVVAERAPILAARMVVIPAELGDPVTDSALRVQAAAGPVCPLVVTGSCVGLGGAAEPGSTVSWQELRRPARGTDASASVRIEAGETMAEPLCLGAYLDVARPEPAVVARYAEATCSGRLTATRLGAEPAVRLTWGGCHD